MTRLIVFMLAFATLSAGTAWATDIHLEGFSEHAVASGHSDEGADGPAEVVPCDHCCHASSHLMGIPLAGRIADCLSVGEAITGDPDDFSSATLPPDIPPPLS